MNDKEYTEGIDVSGSRAAKWFDNYWYHYKWVTIVVAFFLIVGIICTVQMCNKENHDMIVIYAGRNLLSATEKQDVSEVLSAVCKEDFDGDGEKNIGFGGYYIMSEAEINAEEAQTDAEGRNFSVDHGHITSQKQAYDEYLQTGESSVMLVSPWLYESLLKNERLATLADTLGAKPENAMDDYGVRLADTALYQNYAVMQKLPDDTIVCILRPYIIGKSSKEKYYDREKKMFAYIVEGVSESEN